MPNWLRDALLGADVAVLGYFVLINSSYLLLLVAAAVEALRHLRRAPFAGVEDLFRSPLTLPISVIVPAYNERAGIVAAVQAIMALRYPRFEIVVVDDGCTDDTFALLREEFDLVAVPRVVRHDVPVAGKVRSVHVARNSPETLVVVRKDRGGKADALNVGLNLAQHPLLCMVDADSVLDPDALLVVAKPFADDPLRVAATGGVIRIANGCRILAGRVVEVGMPSRWLVRIQVIEYLRAFLVGRAGWSSLGGLVVISGAFGVFRRDLVVAVGGMARDCVGEDAELVVRLHHELRRRGEEYRIVFVPEPVSWSEAPSTLRVLGRQRRRWHRGLTEILRRHRLMIGNPRYGRIGLITLPWYAVFELLAPLVELAALTLIPLSLVLDVVDMDFAWRFLLLAYCYAMLISMAALLLEEIAFHRYPTLRDIAIGFAASVLENLGYRQLLAVWQLQGFCSAVLGRRGVWGQMPRQGLGAPGRPAARR